MSLYVVASYGLALLVVGGLVLHTWWGYRALARSQNPRKPETE